MATSGLRPRKALGQHFLVDGNIVRKILSVDVFRISGEVLEIGPGRGELTLPLARRVKKVWAVEKDPHLSQLLSKKAAERGISNISVLNQDILKLDFRELNLSPDTKMQVVGNLPYNISTPIVERLIEERRLLGKAVLMFQLEVARRLAAGPGSKSYGALSVLVQYFCSINPLFVVPRDSFYPRPRVDSMVIVMDFERPFGYGTGNEQLFKLVVKGAFSQRRKTLLNSMRGFFKDFNREELCGLMEKCGIDPRRRAETLHIKEFLCLADALALTCHCGDVS